MSITHNGLSAQSRLASNLQIAIEHIEAAIWAMKGITTYDDPSDGITDADWLAQIAELLAELNPRTRGARCPECGGTQLIYCEEVNLVYKLIDADAIGWRFGGDSTPEEAKRWRIECGACNHVLRTASDPGEFAGIEVICDDTVITAA